MFNERNIKTEYEYTSVIDENGLVQKTYLSEIVEYDIRGKTLRTTQYNEAGEIIEDRPRKSITKDFLNFMGAQDSVYFENSGITKAIFFHKNEGYSTLESEFDKQKKIYTGLYRKTTGEIKLTRHYYNEKNARIRIETLDNEGKETLFVELQNEVNPSEKVTLYEEDGELKKMTLFFKDEELNRYVVIEYKDNKKYTRITDQFNDSQDETIDLFENDILIKRKFIYRKADRFNTSVEREYIIKEGRLILSEEKTYKLEYRNYKS